MSKSRLCNAVDVAASHEEPRYRSHLRENEVFENPLAAQLLRALTEVAALHRALDQSREQSQIGFDDIKLLVEKNLKLTQLAVLLMERESKAHHFAYHDHLTGLPNRRLLQDRLKQAFSQAARQHKQIALMVLDLDGFKSVNDRLGHAAGDHLLQQVAKRLTDCVRIADTVCRYGGDEFVVMLPELENGETGAIVAQKIHTHLDVPYIVDGNPITVKASIGIAFYPKDGKNFRKLIKRADDAMYRAKEKQHSQERTSA
jgi:diguanylate cyclase